MKVDGDDVVVEFPEETPGSQSEAPRLAEKAGKRASEGNYGKAIDIYQRVLELQPSLHRARRDLAMIYAETGDVDNATNHLIEVLRLDPSDSWNWVVLGILYAGGKSDPETAEKFIRKALELNPNETASPPSRKRPGAVKRPWNFSIRPSPPIPICPTPT